MDKPPMATVSAQVLADALASINSLVVENRQFREIIGQQNLELALLRQQLAAALTPQTVDPGLAAPTDFVKRRQAKVDAKS